MPKRMRYVLLIAGLTAMLAYGDDPPPYRLVRGDTVEFKFTYNPERNDLVTVRPDGGISLVQIGEVQAAGLTAGEISERVQAKYTKFLVHPDVTAIVRTFAAQNVYVGGEVNAPAIIPLHGPMTALRAVLSAGGPKNTARLESVLLIRHTGPNGGTVEKLDLRGVFKGKLADSPLQSLDVVFVPRTRIARVDLFVEQYINSIIPRSIYVPFNYNLNTPFTVHP